GRETPDQPAIEGGYFVERTVIGSEVDDVFARVVERLGLDRPQGLETPEAPRVVGAKRVEAAVARSDEYAAADGIDLGASVLVVLSAGAFGDGHLAPHDHVHGPVGTMHPERQRRVGARLERLAAGPSGCQPEDERQHLSAER